MYTLYAPNTYILRSSLCKAIEQNIANATGRKYFIVGHPKVLITRVAHTHTTCCAVVDYLNRIIV